LKLLEGPPDEWQNRLTPCGCFLLLGAYALLALVATVLGLFLAQ